jgi:leucyl/phenylalanyl-tRNA---protein transferase
MTRQLQWINPNEKLPPSHQALSIDEGANGLLAAGMDLSAARLLEAYSRGIFPWFSEGEPVLWWTPSPRMVLMADEFKVSKSFRKVLTATVNDASYELTVDRDFTRTMQSCAAPRGAESGTWISPAMIDAYSELHAQGFAHSIEVTRHGQTLGGLYCVCIGGMLFGESMFSKEPNGSKIALAALVGWMQTQGAPMIDCQQRTAHLASLGGREINRESFESLLSELTGQAVLPWSSDAPRLTHIKALI